VYGFLERAGTGKKMNKMAGKGFSESQNPVNPVILSKASIEVLQRSGGWETVKRLWLPTCPTLAVETIDKPGGGFRHGR
jgi:hypothetical protein